MKRRMLMPIPRSLPAGAAAATAFIPVSSCSTTLSRSIRRLRASPFLFALLDHVDVAVRGAEEEPADTCIGRVAERLVCPHRLAEELGPCRFDLCAGALEVVGHEPDHHLLAVRREEPLVVEAGSEDLDHVPRT